MAYFRWANFRQCIFCETRYKKPIECFVPAGESTCRHCKDSKWGCSFNPKRRQRKAKSVDTSTGASEVRGKSFLLSRRTFRSIDPLRVATKRSRRASAKSKAIVVDSDAGTGDIDAEDDGVDEEEAIASTSAVPMPGSRRGTFDEDSVRRQKIGRLVEEAARAQVEMDLAIEKFEGIAKKLKKFGIDARKI
jgi:hypothetical protein